MRKEPISDADIRPGMIVKISGERGRFEVLQVHGDLKILLPLDGQHDTKEGCDVLR